MRLYLASAERHWREFQELDIRFVLLSFYHLRHNQHLSALLEYLERLSALGTERRPSSVFLDSGVFSLKSGVAHLSDAALEDYVDNYIDFLERPETQHIELVAEVDVYQDLVDSEGTVLMEGYDRVCQWRDRLYEVVGPRLVPVMAPELTWEQCEEICRDARFNWVAMASLDPKGYPSIVSETCKYINLAHRYGKKIHLFGQTNTQTNFKYLQHADSCDSSTWVSSARHGMVFIHRRGRMDSIDHEQKFRREFYESYYKKIGCDYERILGTHRDHASFCDGPDERTRGCTACADQAQESRKSALIAWRNFAWFILKRVVRRPRETTVRSVTAPKKGSNMTQETPKLAPRIRKTWKGRGVRPLYEEFGGYRCPQYRTRPMDVVATLICQECQNLDMCKLVQKDENANVRKHQSNTALLQGGASGDADLASRRDDGGGEADAPSDQQSDESSPHRGSGSEEILGDRSGPDSSGGERGQSGQRRFDDQCPSVSRPVRRKAVKVRGDVADRWRARSPAMPSSTGQSSLSYGEAVHAWLSAPEKFTEEELARRATKGKKETPHVPTETQEITEVVPSAPPHAEVVVAPPPPEGSGSGGNSVVSVEPPPNGDGKKHLPVVQDAADQALGILRTASPNFMCDTCTIEDSCPKFQPGEICEYKTHLDNLDSRDPDSLLAMMEWGVTMDFERTFMAATQERVQTGGQIDRRVSEQMNNFQRKARELLELKQNIASSDDHAHRQGGVTINNLQVAPPQQGLVARMFAAPPTASDPRLPSSPTVVENSAREVPKI